MRLGEEIDKETAEEVMGWCKCAINNHNIPIPEYSTDRRCAAAVIEEMRTKPASVVDEFNTKLKEWAVGIKAQIGSDDLSNILLFFTPDVICMAALSAIRSHKAQAMTEQSGTYRGHDT
jgi:hypothetical protein